jgi:outer membrane protein assembly factor BamD (BamD/ComL family)
VGTDYAIQHAVALSLLGRRDQATSWLQAHLATLTGSGAAESRDDTRLILGLIAGPGQGTGRAALEQLLANGVDPAKQRIALILLGEGAESIEAREQLRRTTGRLLEATPAHPLTEELLLARAELALVDRFYVEAEGGAKELLARFPGSELRARALTQLASTNWELKRFRTAADFAVQAAGAAGDAAAASALRLLAAEAWYRAAEEVSKDGGTAGAADYTAAGEAYAVVAAEPPPGVTAASVLFQRVMSELGAGRTARAAELIDQFASDARFDATTRWQAEWNLARALQTAGQSELARARIARLRAEPGEAERPAGLRARLAWLEARLAQESGRPEDALKLAREIPASLAGVEPELAREVSGLGRLVEAEALYVLGKRDEALAVLKALRTEEPGTEAALQSFLVEADYQALSGRLVEAQGLLTGFADEHRDHEYAPYAIFQAALHAERRGDDTYYREAYVLLENRLIKATEYAGHPLIFPARMKQGDLLRRLGDFAGAQLIYEDLVNNQSQHPDVLQAEMALADCYRAQAAQDASRFESAVTLLERLRDLASAPVDLRAEAGFKLGDMLATREPRDAKSAAAALAVWGPMLDALVADEQITATLGSRGRYWVGRMAVRMAGVLEQIDRGDEAKNVYRLIVERGLPGVTIAASRLELGVSSPR